MIAQFSHISDIIILWCLNTFVAFNAYGVLS